MPVDNPDVVVIGAGAAGAALTWRLSEHGAKVVCLEQGDWVDPTDYPSQYSDFEAQMLRGGDFSLSPNTRRRPEDYPVSVTDNGGFRPGISMFNAVGGTTIHWQAHFPRFHPSDFRVKSLDGVADDWPLTYQDLEPYYNLNDQMMGVSGLHGDPANPPRIPRATPPLPVGRYGDTLIRGYEKMGWHWRVADQAIISRAYDGRPPCLLHGKCMYGCPIGSKASTDRTYWPKALANGAVLETWARSREIMVDSRGRVSGVLYHDRDGKLQEQPGKIVVVCCNGVGTPRLLLNSKSRYFPEGLANSNGMVGRNFMVHPTRFMEGIFKETLDGHIGPFGAPLYSQEFYETDLSRGFVRGYTMVSGRTYGPLAHSRRIPWGASHHLEMARHFPHTAGIAALCEDLPDKNNRIDLDPDLTDSHGIPAPRVTYTLGDNTARMLEHGAARATEVLKAAGAIEVHDSRGNANMAHLMGTARMGTDPQRSVVNPANRAHDVENLFIVDGSSFVTSAGVNPTSTIGALALRAADGIWERRSEWN